MCVIGPQAGWRVRGGDTPHAVFLPRSGFGVRSRFVGTAFAVAAGMYFAVVGIAHLVGPKGIVRLLEEKKYAVEQLNKSPEPAKEIGEPLKPTEPAAEGVVL